MKNLIQNLVSWPIFGARREVQRLQQQLDARAELYCLSLLPAGTPLPQRPKLHVLEGGGESIDRRAGLAVVESAVSIGQYSVEQYLAAVQGASTGGGAA